MDRVNPLSRPADVSRRSLLTLAAAGAALCCPNIIGSARAQSAGQVVYSTGGGTYAEALETAFLQPFTQDTGIKVLTTGQIDLAKLKAQIMTSTVEVDMMDVVATEVAAASRGGLLQPIDYGIVQVDKSAVLYPDAIRNDSLGLFTYTSGIGYGAQTTEAQRPKIWKDFWDVAAFSGRRGLRSRPNETLEIALLAQGVDPKKIYPIDVAAAFKRLDAIKPHIRKWIDTTPQTVEMLQSNDLDFVNTFNGRVFATNKAGIALGYSSEQLLIELGVIAIPKGARNAKGAMALMNSMAKPERLAKFCELVAYPPIAQRAIDLLPADMKKWVPSTTSGRNLVVDGDWWGEPGRLAQLNTQFQTWLLT
jgi:putative spermidine/putrescine transport system substrate-binding protein